MHCPVCGSETLAVSVPDDLVVHLPDQHSQVAVCTVCLSVTPIEDAPATPPDFGRISTQVPDDPDAAVPLLLAVGLLDHLALYRAEIVALLEQVERAGVDPVLVLERLATDPSLEPKFDLDRRVEQVLQFYE